MGEVAWTRTHQNLRPSQVEMGVERLNHLSLRQQKRLPVGAADLRGLASQFEIIAGISNHSNLLFRTAA
jgi:hypothetical protein